MAVSESLFVPVYTLLLYVVFVKSRCLTHAESHIEDRADWSEVHNWKVALLNFQYIAASAAMKFSYRT